VEVWFYVIGFSHPWSLKLEMRACLCSSIYSLSLMRKW